MATLEGGKLHVIEIEMAKDGAIISSRMLADIVPGFRWFTTKGTLLWIVATKNETEAVEVVNNRRNMILESGLWGNNESVDKIFHSC